MKKLYTLSFLLAAAITFAQATDPFLGTGALDTNGWTQHSGATANQLMITTGSLTYPGMTTAGNKVSLVAGDTEDVNLSCGAAITTTAYYSAIVNVPNGTGLHPNTAAGDYAISLGGTAGASVTGLPARLYLRTGSTGNTFNLGILNNSGGTVAPTFSGDLPFGTNVFVVVKYDIATNTASMFINPALDSTEPASPTLTNNTGTSAAPAQIASIAIRQGGNATTGTGNIEFDNVRVANNWAYVTTGTLGVKQNSIAGLSLFPNPVTNGTLNINSDANAVRTVTIFDILGKQVIKTTTSNSSINVSALNAGVYMVKVVEEGNTATRKLIIR
jgi:hypothetical protein